MERASRRVLIIAGITVAVVVLLIATGYWRDLIQVVADTAEYVHERYGISVPMALVLFGVGEAFFIGSIALMLAEVGENVTWRSIHKFKIRDLNLGSRRMVVLLWVNRFSWIVPWLIVIAWSIGRVPWWATGAALAEVGATFAVGLLVTAGFKLPWWNREEVATDADSSQSSA